MKVAIVTTSFPRSAGDPAGHFVAAEARQLAAQDHDVVVFAPGRGAPRHQGVRVSWIPSGDAFGFPGAIARLRERPARAIDALRFVRECRRRLLREGADRVIAHFLLPCGWPIARGLGVPTEVVGHGTDVRLLMALPTPLARRIIRELADGGATFRFVSDAQRRAIARFVPALQRARVQAPLLDLGDVPHRRRARSQLELPTEARLAVVVGRLVKSKRVNVALDALALVPEVSVAVIGDGPERAQLEAAHPEARFLGQLERQHCLTWIAAADLLVSASRHEGAPTVIREARALSVPVVSPPVADVRAWAESDPGLHVLSR
ncbi:MAG: glycosyltransferase family 4 protein [Polyangiaceae bacterium]